MTQTELEAIADVAKELDIMCVSDEVYEHYVYGENPHIPIASLPDMWDRTITVNSFSKSWNISGWRLGYAYGPGKLVQPINNVANIVNVCPATPLQSALSRVLMADETYYDKLRDKFEGKRKLVSEALTYMGFDIYNSGSAFYLWARIPAAFDDALKFNEMLIEKPCWSNSRQRLCRLRRLGRLYAHLHRPGRFDPRRRDGKTSQRFVI